MDYSLPTDSGDYHLLTKGIELSKNVEGLTCEIGLRLGGGSKFIIEAISANSPSKTHIAIDPYGSILYEHKEKDFIRLDYTNDMRDECLTNIYGFCKEKKVNFLFFNLEDTEFFEKFEYGVPIYNEVKSVVDIYSFVHFDGPHAVSPLMTEIDFFHKRISPGACWCFDDVRGYYDHNKIEQHLFELGFKLIDKTFHKALYQYEN